MSAFPHFVPRLELDVHLKSINGRIDDVMQHISRHREQQLQSRSDLDQLSGSLQDLCTKPELNHLGSRLDLQIACTDVSVTEGLEEQREHTALEVQGLRTELNAQIDAFKIELSGMSEDIVSLGGSLAKQGAQNEETYATKIDQSSMRAQLEKNIQHVNAKLKSQIEAVDTAKASFADLDEASSVLRSADNKLARDIAKLVENVTQTSQNLVFFDQLYRSTFAMQGVVSEVSQSVEDLKRRVDNGPEDPVDVQGFLDIERKRMREHAGQVQELELSLNQALDDVHELKSGRSEIIERCEQNEKELQRFRDLEKEHWAEGQDFAAVYKKATSELQDTCRVQRADMDLHIESAKQETEQLRQQSTIRYFDQLDRALAFQETVEQVQRDGKELNNSMRSMKLPKV